MPGRAAGGMPREYEVELDDVRLRCSEFGPPDGPAVLLLHAAGQDRGSWDGVAAHLGSASWRVVVIDQRGHGASSRPDEYSFELLRDDVVHLVELLELAPVAVIGHSMGGTAATLLAQRRPDLLRLLVLEDTPPPRRTEPPMRFPDRAPEHLRLDPRAWTALMVGQLADPDPAWWHELATIPVPVLILAGGSTSPVPQEELARAASAIPDARLVTLDGAGHQVHRVKEQDFLDVVDAFFAEHSASDK